MLAGVAGTLFLGYCIYFDRKRRSDPEFKKKLRESMSFYYIYVCLQVLLIWDVFVAERKKKVNVSKSGGTVLPDLKDPEAVQNFFLREVSCRVDKSSSNNFI